MPADHRCRGVALTIASTFGLFEHSDLGPTAGIGFVDSWPDDVAALDQLGVDAIRLTFDWARLQPRPQGVGEDWAERYDQLVDAIRAADIRLWATGLDDAVPRWFDNEGGIDDAEALTRWWPRWMERVAERWGDRVDGWLPFDALPAGAEQAWADTRGILRGGPAPVAVAYTFDGLAAVELRASTVEADAIGLAVSTADDRWSDRLGETLREAADEFDGPVLVARCSLGNPTDEAVSGPIDEAVNGLRGTVDDALADGVPVVECFVEPAITGEYGVGLLDDAREPTEAGRAYTAGA